MAAELVTIKVTVETKRNFKGAAYLTNKKMYEAAESASEMFLQLVEKKNKNFQAKLRSFGLKIINYESSIKK